MSALFVERLEYRPMSDADLDFVSTVERVLYDFPWSRGNFADSLVAGHSCWVCCVGKAFVGYSVMMLVLDEAHLLNISILREWQRRGYGRRFLNHLATVARQSGATSMFLEVRPSNEAGCALYQSGGFHAVGIRRGYYPAADGRENAVVLQRVL